jgi:hypothetical protein
LATFGKRLGGGRRDTRRVAIEVPAALTRRSSSGTAVLADVSDTGAKLRGSGLPDAGHDLWVKVGALELFATVIWNRDGQCGMTFDVPLNARQLRQLNREGVLARFLGITPEERLAAEIYETGLTR